MSDDIRAVTEAAFAQFESPAAPETPAEAPAAAPAVAEPPSTSSPEATAERARDGQGRFAPKTAPEAKAAPAQPPPPKKPDGGSTPAPAEAKTAPPPEAKPAAQAVKPPQSWKPALREKWASLPPEVQEEVGRREREVLQALQQSAAHRRVAESFDQAIAPYRGLIQGDPVQVTRGLFQTAAVLQTGTVTQKAHLVASIIQDYGVPVETLAAALDGKVAPQQGQPSPHEYRDPRMDLLIRELQQAKVQRDQAVMYQAESSIGEFVQEQPEFLEDVREDMASELDLAARRGLRMTPKEAYDAACWKNSEVRKILQQRERAAAASPAATQRAQAAASSVRSEPAVGPGPGEPVDVRSVAARAFAAHGL